MILLSFSKREWVKEKKKEENKRVVGLEYERKQKQNKKIGGWEELGFFQIL